MGKKDSSKTRVQPIFDQLLEADPTGTTWLPKLLDCAPLSERLGPARVSPGTVMTPDTRFEYPAAPSESFLRWLLEHPEAMTWPTTKGEKDTFSATAQEWRERLFGHEGPDKQKEAQAEALAELARRGSADSSRAWWAFEGFTKVDFCIQTEKLVLFVEGKRTDVLTSSTDWFPQRNQLVRNMEVVADVAGDRACGVVLAVENTVTEIDNSVVEASTPHLNPKERITLSNRYLGQVQWEGLCDATGVDLRGLPDVLE